MTDLRHPVNVRHHGDERSGPERLADRVVGVIGSWPSIVGHLVFIAGWLAFNAAWPHTFDQPDLTHLNLILSCEAALAAALILLASKRQAAKDRDLLEHTFADSERMLAEIDRNTIATLAIAKHLAVELSAPAPTWGEEEDLP